MSGIKEVQPLANEFLKEEMSYLYGRDPSILAYGQRPLPSHESRKNLISMLDGEKEDIYETRGADKTSATSTDSVPLQTIRVFLRMKPFPVKMTVTPQQAEAYSILNSTTLLTKIPALDSNSSSLKRDKSCEVTCKKFFFTQTFGTNTTQLQLFEQAVKPQMLDFLNGKNAIVMSYGTTNSGKTYTLQGTAESPGMIPRGIDFVFSQITPGVIPSYKPFNQCDVVQLTNQDCLREMDHRLKILAFNPAEKNFNASTFKQMQESLNGESPMSLSHDQNLYYSVWVSFAEIYNEAIYDLLWNDCQKKRKVLKLATDSVGRTFIKDLRSICVSSGAEAYQVLMAGQYNLRVAATALNSRSSRSHCIFTIKLLQFKTKNDPLSVRMSTFTFCDLAGSERLKKTLNVGDRLREAQNINTSLLVLGRCLKTIHETQSCSKSKIESIGPFRESKLTRLFQRALSGKEQIALIVNVNPAPNLYVETQNVLNFSAIAKKIVIEHKSSVRKKRSLSKFSRLVTRSAGIDMDWENTDFEDAAGMSEGDAELESHIHEDDHEDQQEDLKMENERLTKEITELRASVLSRDLQTRQEMTKMYTEIVKQLESEWKNRMINMEEQQEDLREVAVRQIEVFYEEKMDRFNTQQKSHPAMEDQVGFGDRGIPQKLEIQNACLQTKVDQLKICITDLRRAKKLIETEKSQLVTELILVQEEKKRVNELLAVVQKSLLCGDAALVVHVEELNGIIQTKNERIRTMKIFLDEAKEEYISITNQAQEMERRIEEQNEILSENTEHINNLELQLFQINNYSEQQSQIIENLEEELMQRTRDLEKAEELIHTLSQRSDLPKSPREYEESKTSEQRLVSSKSFREGSNLDSSHEKELLLDENIVETENELQILKRYSELSKNQLDWVDKNWKDFNIDDDGHGRIQEAENVCCTQKLVHRKMMNDSRMSSKDEKLDLKEDDCILARKIWESHPSTDLAWNNEYGWDPPKKTIDRIVFLESHEREYLNIYMAERRETQSRLEHVLENLQYQTNAMATLEQQKNEEIASLRNELDRTLENSQEAKRNLEMLIEAQISKDRNLQDEISNVLSREQDKEREIASLQGGMKVLIQCNDTTVKNMEIEMKTILKDLTSMKDLLNKEEERNKKMDKDYKKVIHVLQSQVSDLEQKTKEKEIECEMLRVKIGEIKRSLDDAQHELEVFIRNRDETVTKYEELVKSKDEKLALKDTEIRILRADTTENISSNQHGSDHERRMKSDEGDMPSSQDLALIKPSGPEFKESPWSRTKSVSVSMKKTKKKKLFTISDGSFFDVDQEEPQPSPYSSTRNLRNRRK